jgi:hypothetical protein
LNTLREAAEYLNDQFLDVYESFLIPFWNFPSFFSRSSVDSSDGSLQHQCWLSAVIRINAMRLMVSSQLARARRLLFRGGACGRGFVICLCVVFGGWAFVLGQSTVMPEASGSASRV